MTPSACVVMCLDVSSGNDDEESSSRLAKFAEINGSRVPVDFYTLSLHITDPG